MKKFLVILVILVISIVLVSCKNKDENITGDMSGGIYTQDGNLVISYESLVKKYGVDITQDLSLNESGLFLDILSELDIHEKVNFICPLVKKIGDFQFAFVRELVQIELPETLETVGSYAFYQSGLQSINFPLGLMEIKNNAFDSCQELEDIKLNSGLKIIDVSAFRYTQKLKEIEIPDSVQEIRASAFADTGLSYVYLPETLQVIDDTAFLHIDTVCYGGKIQSIDNFGAAKVHEFTEGNKCNICGNVVEYVPYRITQAEFISENGECRIPDIFSRDNIEYKVVKIEAHAYEGNREIKKVIFPDSLIKIGDEAFKDCYHIEEVSLNDALKEIGQAAFLNCISLEKIEIPERISTLNQSFQGCAGLKEITLPKEIILYQFDFEGCDNLSTVIFKGTKQEWDRIPVQAPAPIMETTIDQVFGNKITIITEE